MISEFREHPLAYGILAIGLVAFVVMFLHLWPNREYQQYAAVGLGIFYFIWGVSVHLHHKHIHRKVVFEYFAVATLATALLVLLLS